MYLAIFCEKYGYDYPNLKKEIMAGEYEEFVTFVKKEKQSRIFVKEVELLNRMNKSHYKVKNVPKVKVEDSDKVSEDSKDLDLSQSVPLPRNKVSFDEMSASDLLDGGLSFEELLRIERVSKIMLVQRQTKKFDRDYVGVKLVEEKIHGFFQKLLKSLSGFRMDIITLFNDKRHEDPLKFNKSVEKKFNQVKRDIMIYIQEMTRQLKE